MINFAVGGASGSPQPAAAATRPSHPNHRPKAVLETAVMPFTGTT